MKFTLSALLIILLVSSCVESKQDKLPILGRIEVDEISGDTTYHVIEKFSFVDQDSMIISNESFNNKIYVADFFFISCPDICPIMKTQMLRVYENYKDDPRVGLLSHTIDPRHDDVAALKEFSERLGVDNGMWKFVTGEKDIIYKLGQTSYMASIADDATTGLVHSGRFFLIDQNRRIRGAYDGTDPVSVDYLITDIERLLTEDE